MLRSPLVLLAALLLLTIPCKAQEKTWLVGIGRNFLQDTYLSQEHYTGIEVDFLHAATKPYKRDSLWSRTNTYHVEFARTTPRSSNSSDLSLMFDYSFGMHRTFALARSFTLALGGQGEVFIGGIYNTRNGNNPAQLKAGINLAPSLRAAYRFRLWRQPLRIAYCASLPLLGAAFSPAYGQSYYEIFSEGHYDHNICFTWFVDDFSYAHRATLDIFFPRAALTLGYLGTYRQARLNSLSYHSYSHIFVIGVTL